MEDRKYLDVKHLKNLYGTRIDAALKLIETYGHEDPRINKILRALLGSEEAYQDWITGRRRIR